MIICMSLCYCLFSCFVVMQQQRPSSPELPRLYTQSSNDGNDVFNQSINYILSWSKNVMTAIESMQWQAIGFESNADGTQNLSRPLYNIPNPQLVCNQIIQQ